MRGLAFVLLVVTVLLLAPLPAASQASGQPGGTARVTFYGHIFNTGLDFPQPANTQYPWGEADFATSGPIDDTHCGPETPVGRLPNPSSGNELLVPCDEQANTKLVLFTTAGPVQIKQARDFDYAKLHNEFGMTEDVELDTTQSVNATLYMTPASTHAWLHTPAETPCINGDPPENVPCLYPYWRWHAGVAPEFEVKAWLYAMVLGEHGANAAERPPIREKLPEATLVAFGQTAPRTTISSDGYADNPRVHRFDIDLGAPLVPRVSRDANLVMVFSWNSDVGGVEYMADTWRINSGEFFATSFTVPVKRGFRVDAVQPAMVHDKVVVLATMNTPWGSYDVDPGSVQLSISRDDGTPVDATLQRVADFQVAHGAHYKPINVTWVWDWRTDGAKPGVYVAKVGGANYQHSARDAREATFRITPDGRITDVLGGEVLDEALVGANATGTGGAEEPDRGIPAPALLLAAAAALAAATGRRRR